MEDDDLLYWVSTGALISTIGLFMTGIPVTRQVIKTKDASSVPLFLFTLIAFNCLGYVFYGIFTEDSTVLYCNIVGTVLHFFYILVYFIYCPRKEFFPSLGKFTAIGAIFLSMVYYYQGLTDVQEGNDFIGLVCSIVVAITLVLPIGEIYECWKNGSAEGISLLVTFANLFTSSLWFLYGFLIHDIYIQLPNAPGIIISLARICIFNLYVETTKSKKNKSE